MTPCRQKNTASQSQIKLLVKSSLTEADKRVFSGIIINYLFTIYSWMLIIKMQECLLLHAIKNYVLSIDKNIFFIQKKMYRRLSRCEQLRGLVPVFRLEVPLSYYCCFSKDTTQFTSLYSKINVTNNCHFLPDFLLG